MNTALIIPITSRVDKHNQYLSVFKYAMNPKYTEAARTDVWIKSILLKSSSL